MSHNCLLYSQSVVRLGLSYTFFNRGKEKCVVGVSAACGIFPLNRSQCPIAILNQSPLRHASNMAPKKTQNHSVSESSSTSVGVFTNISPDSLRVSAKETSTPSDFQQLLLKEFKRAEEPVKKCKKVRTTTATLITREDAIGNEEQHV